MRVMSIIARVIEVYMLFEDRRERSKVVGTTTNRDNQTKMKTQIKQSRSKQFKTPKRPISL